MHLPVKGLRWASPRVRASASAALVIHGTPIGMVGQGLGEVAGYGNLAPVGVELDLDLDGVPAEMPARSRLSALTGSLCVPERAAMVER